MRNKAKIILGNNLGESEPRLNKVIGLFTDINNNTDKGKKEQRIKKCIRRFLSMYQSIFFMLHFRERQR